MREIKSRTGETISASVQRAGRHAWVRVEIGTPDLCYVTVPLTRIQAENLSIALDDCACELQNRRRRVEWTGSDVTGPTLLSSVR